MNFIRTSLKLDKKYLKILLAFLCLGIFVGFIFYKKIDSTFFIDDIQNIVTNLESVHINFFFLHFIVISILIASSFMIFGVLLFPVYFLWEIICISYSIFIFGEVFGLSGVFFGVFYNLFLKGLWLIVLYLVFKNVYFIIKNNIIHKKDDFSFKKQYQIVFISILIILIYDIFIYFFGNSILLKLTFILT